MENKEDKKHKVIVERFDIGVIVIQERDKRK